METVRCTLQVHLLNIHLLSVLSLALISLPFSCETCSFSNAISLFLFSPSCLQVAKRQEKNGRELKVTPTWSTKYCSHYISIVMYNKTFHSPVSVRSALTWWAQIQVNMLMSARGNMLLMILWVVEGLLAWWACRGEETRRKKRRALRFQPKLHVSILSYTPSLCVWRLSRAGCKDLTEKCWSVFKATFVYLFRENQWIRKEIKWNYIFLTFLFF